MKAAPARLWRVGLCVAAALSLLLAGGIVPARAVTEMARRDWYFRETLPAIRDWETLLEQWERGVPEGERVPILPVPATGDAVTWPNPIPLPLLPHEDRDCRVSVRLAGGRVRVERTAPGREPERREAAPGEGVPGYKHPGGGGKDQWYHRYDRRFDRLTNFRARPAPFALELAAPLDLRPGSAAVDVGVREVGGQSVSLSLDWRFLVPDGEGAVREDARGSRQVTLAPGARETIRIDLRLARPGGGLLLLSLRCGGERYWLPLLTHVEQVAPVLDGIARSLEDLPDPVGAARLAELRVQAARGCQHARHGWRALFEEACGLRDLLLLRHIRFDTLLFVKRKPFFSEQPFMDAHHLYNRPGGGLYRLSPVHPGGRVTPVVDSLGEGVYRDVHLHPDAGRLLFAFGNGSDDWDGGQSYHIYEVGADGKGLRRITSGPKNDCEPFYLPDDRIGFTSDRSEHFVMCGGDRHVANLFTMEADGSGVRQLSHNAFNEFTPSVLPDGRILYSRWEYNERSVTSLHKLFTMHPDGTEVAPFYGNATIRPNVTQFGRAVPGSPKVMALFTAHHGQTHGPIGLIDPRLGVDGPAPVTLLTPNVPVTGEKAEESRYGWYSDPMPLSESLYLCSYTPTALPWLEKSWAIYVGDRHGNLAILYRDEAISCAEPVPLVRRPAPRVLPRLAAENGREAETGPAALLLLDAGIGLKGVPRCAVKQLRILEDLPRKSVHRGGVVPMAASGIYTGKRILGTVPVEADGSAHFTVPADRNVYFALLDGDGREIQRMRSVVCLKPGERRTCIGCHEPRTTAPPNARALAARRPAREPEPPPWGDAPMSFLRDVQPVLNARCVSCHAHGRSACGVLLTDDLTDQFSVGYLELLPYLSLANAMRWDHPDDVYARPPYTYGSKVSRLVGLLDEGHHGVRLTAEEWTRLTHWIDANATYYDRYESIYPDRRIFEGEPRKRAEEVYGRRCASCHGGNGNRDDGRGGTWWLSLNRRDASASRALRAPLARAAGGWGFCDGEVFADTADADYQALLALFTSVRDQLAGRPREDLLSLRGTDAERQVVRIPEPPARPPAPPGPGPGWVYLSDLPWERARSGWTPNGDGLPRRDRAIEGQALRLGPRTYRKGIGTHAPSEIVYRLGGKYARFHAVVGGGEANGTVLFQVVMDGEVRHDSGVLHGLRGVQTIDVDVAGGRELCLRVTDAGDGHTCDVAHWGDARVLKAGEGQPAIVGLGCHREGDGEARRWEDDKCPHSGAEPAANCSCAGQRG